MDGIILDVFWKVFARLIVVIKLRNNKIMGNTTQGVNQSFSHHENSCFGSEMWEEKPVVPTR